MLLALTADRAGLLRVAWASTKDFPTLKLYGICLPSNTVGTDTVGTESGNSGGLHVHSACGWVDQCWVRTWRAVQISTCACSRCSSAYQASVRCSSLSHWKLLQVLVAAAWKVRIWTKLCADMCLRFHQQASHVLHWTRIKGMLHNPLCSWRSTRPCFAKPQYLQIAFCIFLLNWLHLMEKSLKIWSTNCTLACRVLRCLASEIPWVSFGNSSWLHYKALWPPGSHSNM